MKALFLVTVEVEGEPPALMSEGVWLAGLGQTIENQIKHMIICDVMVSVRKEPRSN